MLWKVGNCPGLLENKGEIVDTVYIVLLWGPVVAIFFMGAALLLEKSPVSNLVAVATPVVLAGVEALIVITVLGDNGSISAKESELIPLLQVQVFALSILALMLFAIMFTAWQYSKPPKNIDEGPYPLGEC